MYRPYIPTLNGWRAVAISLVIAAHSTTMLRNSGTNIGAKAAAIFSHAGIGVDIFFSISGFFRPNKFSNAGKKASPAIMHVAIPVAITQPRLKMP